LLTPDSFLLWELAVKRNQRIVEPQRRGFTLIEMLVVIAIITVLASLILGGVMVFMRKGPEVKNRNDILQLSEGLQKFKAKFGFYPPNQIRLRANMAAYSTPIDALDSSSVAVLSSMFPNLTGVTNIQWAGATPMPANGIVLDGDQCLVFFLGGIPEGSGAPPLGFSLNPQNPADLTGDRLKFMDFDSARIKLMHNNNPFPSYLDSFYTSVPDPTQPKPFVYFSSNKRPNGYTPTANTYGVFPYIEKPATGTTPAQYYMPNQFQIISAGPDGKFGPGNAPLPAIGNGLDDMANFSDKKLGVAP
jgi:prepilin-type N-terminal cleavage/methylation domain-containing protein